MTRMFNALRADDLLVGIGHVLRSTADKPGALEDFERTQLLSAYSVSRLLAAEQRDEAQLLAWLHGALDEATGGDEAIAAAADGPAIGEALALLLERLEDDDPRRAAIHGVLREMAAREVAALADLPGGTR